MPTKSPGTRTRGEGCGAMGWISAQGTSLDYVVLILAGFLLAPLFHDASITQHSLHEDARLSYDYPEHYHSTIRGDCVYYIADVYSCSGTGMDSQLTNTLETAYALNMTLQTHEKPSDRKALYGVTISAMAMWGVCVVAFVFLADRNQMMWPGWLLIFLLAAFAILEMVCITLFYNHSVDLEDDIRENTPNTHVYFGAGMAMLCLSFGCACAAVITRLTLVGIQTKNLRKNRAVSS